MDTHMVVTTEPLPPPTSPIPFNMFIIQHGFIAMPVLNALMDSEYFGDFLRQQSESSILEMSTQCGFNSGYFNIAVRILDTLRLVVRDGNRLRPTMLSDSLFTLPSGDLIQKALHFPWNEFLEEPTDDMLESFEQMVQSVMCRWAPTTQVFAQLLDGLILAPCLIALHKHAVRWDYSQKVYQIQRSGFAESSWQVMCTFLEWLHWGAVNKADDAFVMSEQGRFLLERSLNMGVAVSYKALVSGARELLKGDPARILAVDIYGNETHVDRTLNGNGCTIVFIFLLRFKTYYSYLTIAL